MKPKLLAAFYSKTEKGKLRQTQLVAYLSMVLNIILLILLLKGMF